MNPSTAFALAVLASVVSTTAPSLAAPRAEGVQIGASAPAGSLALLAVQQVPGTYHIAVSGRALASTPLVLTLFGTVSADIPDVVVNRRYVVTDAAGIFKLEIPAAGDYYRDGLLTVVATSPSGAILAKRQIILKPANADVPVPIEERLKTET